MWNQLNNLSNGAATFIGAFTGAIGGLIAILIGALYNARLNRKRDDRLRQQDAATLKVALLEELKMVHHALLQNAKIWNESPGQISVGPDLAHLIKVFPQVVPKLGLLKDDVVAAVIAAYVMIEQHGESLWMLGAKTQEFSSGRRLFIMPPERSALVAKMSANLAEDIKKAIDLLTKETSSSRPLRGSCRR